MKTDSDIPDFVWQALLSVLMKIGIPVAVALALIGAVFLFMLYKGQKLPWQGGQVKDHERRKPDPVIHELTGLVKAQVETNQRLLSQQEDHKGICLATCDTLRAVEKCMIQLAERMENIGRDAREAARGSGRG